MPSNFPRRKGFGYPREIIAKACGVSSFALSTADVEDLLAERGVVVSRQASCLWVNRFGWHFADCIKRDRPQPNSKWHLDDVVITICGQKYWLWRALDADGEVLDILVQPRWNATAAKRFLIRLIVRSGDRRVVITDKLRSYIKPIKTLAANTDHRALQSLNTAVEVSHPLPGSGLNTNHEKGPTRKPEKITGRFKSAPQAQRFLSAHDQINTSFRPRRYKLAAKSYRHAGSDTFSHWNEYTANMTA